MFYDRLYLGYNLYFDGHVCTHQHAPTHCILNAFYFLYRNQLLFPSIDIRLSLFSKIKHRTKSNVSLMYERAKLLGLSVHLDFNDPYTVTYSIGDN